MAFILAAFDIELERLSFYLAPRGEQWKFVEAYSCGMKILGTLILCFGVCGILAVVVDECFFRDRK